MLQYYKIIETDDRLPNYGKLLNICRVEEGHTYESFSRKDSPWIDSPRIFAELTGIGGDTDAGYIKITEEEAMQLINVLEARNS